MWLMQWVIERQTGKLLPRWTSLPGCPRSLILVPLNTAPGVFSGLLFGDSQLKRLIVPLSIFLGGMMTHGIVYGYYRGRLLNAHGKFYSGMEFRYRSGHLGTYFLPHPFHRRDHDGHRRNIDCKFLAVCDPDIRSAFPT